jgi:hypothetical protein
LTLASSTIVTSAFAPSGAGARRRSESFETTDDFPEHGLPHITIKHAEGRAVEAFVCVSSRDTSIRVAAVTRGRGSDDDDARGSMRRRRY